MQIPPVRDCPAFAGPATLLIKKPHATRHYQISFADPGDQRCKRPANYDNQEYLAVASGTRGYRGSRSKNERGHFKKAFTLRPFLRILSFNHFALSQERTESQQLRNGDT